MDNKPDLFREVINNVTKIKLIIKSYDANTRGSTDTCLRKLDDIDYELFDLELRYKHHDTIKEIINYVITLRDFAKNIILGTSKISLEKFNGLIDQLTSNKQ